MPTEKCKIAVKKLVEISRNAKGQKNITLGRILRESGYSEATAIKPSQVTKSKGFQELMNEMLPDDKLMQKHNMLLNSVILESCKVDSLMKDKDIKELIECNNGFKVKKIFRSEHGCTVYYYRPDNNSVDKALDKGYKLKGSYSAEKSKIDLGGSLTVIETTNYGDKPKHN